MTLTELTRLNNYRIPILPGTDSKSRFLWSVWAMMVVFFLWPSNFAAPLANSSLAWNPSSEIVGPIRSFSMHALDNTSRFGLIGFQEWRTNSLVNAAILTTTEANYAFNNTFLPLRRYFRAPENMTDNSTVSATFPYFDADVHWIDATPDVKGLLSNNSYTDFTTPAVGEDTLTRDIGSVVLVRNSSFDPHSGSWLQNQGPDEAPVFSASRLVAVLVSSFKAGDDLDGSPADANSLCSNQSSNFGKLPGLKQYNNSFYFPNSYKFDSADCYQIGTVNITAGLYSATDCKVHSAGNFKSGTCSISRELTRVRGDWGAPVVWEMLTETMKETVITNGTYDQMTNGLGNYVTGMLTLAYHAAWSSAMEKMAIGNEDGKFRRAESMVRAGVSRGKLYAWLAMNLSLLISAIFVYIALGFSSVKAIRDTTLTPLMADFSAITDSQRGSGLRNAAALSKKDQKLPRIKLNDDDTYNFVDEVNNRIHQDYNGAVSSTDPYVEREYDAPTPGRS